MIKPKSGKSNVLPIKNVAQLYQNHIRQISLTKPNDKKVNQTLHNNQKTLLLEIPSTLVKGFKCVNLLKESNQVTTI
jgi:hypothetical protein